METHDPLPPAPAGGSCHPSQGGFPDKSVTRAYVRTVSGFEDKLSMLHQDLGARWDHPTAFWPQRVMYPRTYGREQPAFPQRQLGEPPALK